MTTQSNKQLRERIINILGGSYGAVYKPCAKQLEDLLDQALKSQKKETVEKIKSIMDKKRSKQVADDIEMFCGKRECPVCGYSPEFQRKYILKLLEEKE